MPPSCSNMTREQYMEAVEAVKEHIQAGDIFQLVLSHRFKRRTFADPFEVYRCADPLWGNGIYVAVWNNPQRRPFQACSLLARWQDLYLVLDVGTLVSACKHLVPGCRRTNRPAMFETVLLLNWVFLSCSEMVHA